MSERTSCKKIRQRRATNKVAHRSPTIPREALGRTRQPAPGEIFTEHKEKLILCKTAVAVVWLWDGDS